MHKHCHVHLLLLVVCIARSAHAAGELMVVVGDVSSTSVRVLIDDPTPLAARRSLSLLVAVACCSSNATESQHELSLGHDGPPAMLVLAAPAIQRACRCTAKLAAPGFAPAHISFHTHPLQGAASIGALSCDRASEDGDDEHWLVFAQQQRALGFDAVLHLGDQIYADAIVARARAHAHTFDALLAAYRAEYRKTWGRPAVQAVLRRGAHLMLGDDHDFINNLDALAIAANDTVRLIAAAALQAFGEYQLQLAAHVGAHELAALVAHVRSAAAGPAPRLAASEAVLLVRRFGATDFVLVDTRVQRAIWPVSPQDQALGNAGDGSDADDAAMLSLAQAAALQAALARARDDQTDVVLVAAIPFTMPHVFAQIAARWEGERYWGHASMRAGRDRWLARILAPDSRVRLIIAGDYHQLQDSSLCAADTHMCVRQLLTSGMTRTSTSLASNPVLFGWNLLMSLARRPLALLEQKHWYQTGISTFLGRSFAVVRLDDSGRLADAYGVRGTLTPVEAVLQALFDNAAALVIALAVLFAVRVCLPR